MCAIGVSIRGDGIALGPGVGWTWSSTGPSGPGSESGTVDPVSHETTRSPGVPDPGDSVGGCVCVCELRVQRWSLDPWPRESNRGTSSGVGCGQDGRGFCVLKEVGFGDSSTRSLSPPPGGFGSTLWFQRRGSRKGSGVGATSLPERLDRGGLFQTSKNHPRVGCRALPFGGAERGEPRGPSGAGS